MDSGCDLQIGGMQMNSVGIDISKGRSTVAVMRPFGEVVTSDYKRQKSEFQIYIATNVATTASEAQKFWISWLVQNENQ